MEIPPDPTPDMLSLPRFDDDAIDMWELLRRLAEQVVDVAMDAEADQPCGAGPNKSISERRFFGGVLILVSMYPDERVSPGQNHLRKDTPCSKTTSHTYLSSHPGKHTSTT